MESEYTNFEKRTGLKIIEENEFKENKKKFIERLENSDELETKEYSSYNINWYMDDNVKNYDQVKIKNRLLLEKANRLFLLAKPNKTISGKPQQLFENIQRLILLKKIMKINKTDKSYEYFFKFIDEPYDKRYDGNTIDSIAFDFYIYKIIDNNKEYYVLSEKLMPNEQCDINGMEINLNDISQLTDSLKIGKVSTIFIVKDFISAVKSLSPKSIINLTENNKITSKQFHDYVFLHPSNKIFDYCKEFDLLREAQLLSGKYEGYPLHILKMGPVGSGKTTEAEALNYKFKEGILEAANSTLKALVPSFKEKPANLGYIAQCNRIAIIDELMKMVEASMSHDNSRLSNYFGQMNMLLEQKDRIIGSGNNNFIKLQATSKVCIGTNNLNGRLKLENHLSVIDATTLSRMILWVQTNQEVEKIYSKKSMTFISDAPHTYKPPKAQQFGVNRNNDIESSLCVGGITNDIFLTIFDSCQQFVVNFDYDKCKKIYDTITNLVVGSLKNVWRARGLHHTILILDGITKERCLFQDYDSDFTPKEIDYDNLEKILFQMVAGWETIIGDE